MGVFVWSGESVTNLSWNESYRDGTVQGPRFLHYTNNVLIYRAVTVVKQWYGIIRFPVSSPYDHPLT